MADDKAEGTAEETTEETASPEPAGTGFNKAIAESEAPAAKPATTEETEETETSEEATGDDSTEVVESISDEQYTEAEKLGISRSQADEIGVDGLPRVMRKLTPPDSAQASDAPAARDATEPLVEEPSGTKHTGTGLDTDDYDTNLLDAISRGDERVEAEVSRRLGPIQDRLHKLTVKAELREERETTARFNGYIESLGESWSKEFGSTNPTKSQQGNRSEVRTNMEVERIGRESLGLPSFSEDQLFQCALSKGHPEKAMQLARENISSTLKKRSTQMISRPTQSKGNQPTGKQKAMRSVAAKMVKMGLDPGVIHNDAEDLSMFGH